MEFGKSVSQPPVPKPTWPKISRFRKDSKPPSAEEPVEGLVVQLLDELRPDLPDARDVALAHRPAHVGEVGALFSRRSMRPPRRGRPAAGRRGLGVVGLALEVHDRRWGAGASGFGNGSVPGPRGRCSAAGPWRTAGSASRPSRRSARVAALEADGAQPAADLVRLVDDGPQAHLHQLVRGDDAGEPSADDGDLGAALGRRDGRAPPGGRGSRRGVREVRADMVMGGCSRRWAGRRVGTVDVMGYGSLRTESMG